MAWVGQAGGQGQRWRWQLPVDADSRDLGQLITSVKWAACSLNFHFNSWPHQGNILPFLLYCGNPNPVSLGPTSPPLGAHLSFIICTMGALHCGSVDATLAEARPFIQLIPCASETSQCTSVCRMGLSLSVLSPFAAMMVSLCKIISI